MIPKIIHQIWIQGWENMPIKLKSYSQRCQNINNDFKYIFWDDKSILRHLNDFFGKYYVLLYNGYNVYAQKADFARYAILSVYGGIYLDTDMVCRKNLEPFLNCNLFFTTDAFYIFYKRYLNGIIGVIPNHPLFKIIFKNLSKRYDEKENITYSTGTKLLYDSVKQYEKQSGDKNYCVIDSKYLHPCQLYDDDDCPEKCKECFVAHTNQGSWNSSLSNFLNKTILKNWKFILIFIIIILILIILFKGQSYKLVNK